MGPKCLGAAAKDWLAARQTELLEVPYFHVVFTLPKPTFLRPPKRASRRRVADIAYQNKAVVYRLLFKAGAETLITIAAEPKHLGARIGFTGVLHSWGSAMTHHPHVHWIVPGGGNRFLDLRLWSLSGLRSEHRGKRTLLKYELLKRVPEASKIQINPFAPPHLRNDPTGKMQRLEDHELLLAVRNFIRIAVQESRFNQPTGRSIVGSSPSFASDPHWGTKISDIHHATSIAGNIEQPHVKAERHAATECERSIVWQTNAEPRHCGRLARPIL